MSLSTKGKRRAIIKKARRREEQGAEEINGRRSYQSGGGVIKGDFRDDRFCFEDKFTVRGKQYLLKEDTILKILGEAHRTGRIPVIKIGYQRIEVAVLIWEDFMGLKDGDSESTNDR